MVKVAETFRVPGRYIGSGVREPKRSTPGARAAPSAALSRGPLSSQKLCEEQVAGLDVVLNLFGMSAGTT